MDNIISYPVIYNMINKSNHLLIAGATGSGKSVIENDLLIEILLHEYNKSELILIDPKKVELINYSDLKNVLLYADNIRDIIQALKAACNIMDTRYKTMQRERLKNYPGNKIYIFIDEYADIITISKKSVNYYISRLTQLGRAAGIHLILCTQRPTREIISGQIKVNIDYRIALRTACRRDSINIIDTAGAEKLPRYGNCIFKSPDGIQIYNNIPLRSENEINNIINLFK